MNPRIISKFDDSSKQGYLTFFSCFSFSTLIISPTLFPLFFSFEHSTMVIIFLFHFFSLTKIKILSRLTTTATAPSRRPSTPFSERILSSSTRRTLSSQPSLIPSTTRTILSSLAPKRSHLPPRHRPTAATSSGLPTTASVHSSTPTPQHKSSAPSNESSGMTPLLPSSKA